MAAKTENSSPSKLSPSERLARKRAAARLRQQRCRARKRQALLEQRRQEHEVRPTQMPRSQDSRSKQLQEVSSRSASYLKEMKATTTTEPIYNCVSFDSQRSLEESQRTQGSPQTKDLSAKRAITILTSASLIKKETESATVSSDSSDDALVSEEEAAVAAMLSLKSGVKSEPKSPTTQPVAFSKGRVANSKTVKYRYYRPWEPRRYEAYEYGRHAPFYSMHMAQRVPPPQFRYYSPTYGKVHTRYNFE